MNPLPKNPVSVVYCLREAGSTDHVQLLYFSSVLFDNGAMAFLMLVERSCWSNILNFTIIFLMSNSTDTVVILQSVWDLVVYVSY